jgi:protein LTV1
VLEEYNSGDEEESVTSTAPLAPRVFKEKRPDFDAIMDEFLGGYKVLGKKMVKKTNGRSGGIAELDEIRRELGRAKIS